MGDRCYVEITVRRQDLAKWENLGYTDGDSELVNTGEVKSYVSMYDSERNYGVNHDTDDVVSGCPMFGSHSSGGDYGAYLFAWDGETFKQIETNHDGELLVKVNPSNGQPSEYDLAHVRSFLEFSRKVGQLVGRAPLWCNDALDD